MPKYIVERYLPQVTPEQLTAAASRAKRTSRQMSQEGTPIRYLRSIFVPGEDKCLCLFDAASAEDVARANRRADIPFERVLEALQIESDDL